jgi:hypothetical protein
LCLCQLASPPELVFNVIDQGSLDEKSNPVDSQNAFVVAPEVVHLSRFADSYKVYPDESCTARVDLCFFNAGVAQKLKCDSLARMWRMVASLLDGAGVDVLEDCDPLSSVLQFALLPTIKSLLEERANAGDVQTCVTLCEILQVIDDSDKENISSRLPGLTINVVREWYLSYIDLLRQMCLFSHASSLIRSCKDPVIGKLNQQATT